MYVWLTISRNPDSISLLLYLQESLDLGQQILLWHSSRCGQTLWPRPLVHCCSAALQGFFCWFHCPSLPIWTNYCRDVQRNVPRFLGFEFLWDSILQKDSLLCSRAVAALFRRLMDSGGCAGHRCLQGIVRRPKLELYRISPKPHLKCQEEQLLY